MHQANPSILSVATATPPHRIPQPVAKDFARAMFADVYRDIDRLLPIFDHSGVEHRNFCVPAEWFYEDHSFSEKNDLYIERDRKSTRLNSSYANISYAVFCLKKKKIEQNNAC